MYILLAFIVIALVAGFIADYVWGRRHAYERWELFVVGIVGSFVGGIIFSVIDDLSTDAPIDWLGAIRPTGLIGSIIGAIVFLPLYGWARDRFFRKPVPAAPTKNTAMKSSSSKKNR